MRGNYGKVLAFYFDVYRVEKIADSLEELLGDENKMICSNAI